MRFVRLKHAVEVDRYGSITAAAKALNTTQSTVTKSVAAMEQDLGYALFVRRARGVVATEKGREFLNRASRVLSDFEHLVEDSRQEKSAANSLFRIGVCPALLQGLMNRAIAEVINKQPEVRVQLEAVSAERGVKLLHRGDVDVLLAPVDTLASESEFRFERIPSIEAGLYVRKDHPLASRAGVTRDDIKAYPIIAPDPLTPYTEQLLEVVSKNDGQNPLRQLHVMEYFPIVAQIVHSTDSVSVVSRTYAATNAFQTRFRLLDIELFTPLEMGCAWRSRWLPSRVARMFVNALNATG